MAYRPPPELKSRIESIKKKFEVVEKQTDSEASEHQVRLSPLQNGKQSVSNSRNGNSFMHRGKSPPYAIRANNSKPSSHEEVITEAVNSRRQAGSSACRGNIRRAHAFRCDKTVIGRQASVNPEKKLSVVNNRVKMFEDKRQNERDLESIHEKEKSNVNSSVTFENQNVDSLQPYAPGKVYHKDNYSPLKSPFLNDSRKQIGVTGNKVSSNDKRPLGQERNEKHQVKLTVQKISSSVNGGVISGPVVKKTQPSVASELASSEILKQDDSQGAEKMKDKGENDAGIDTSLVLTNTLKAALRAPLPAGPPPKKPPRTFAHHKTAGKSVSANSVISSEKKSCKSTGESSNSKVKISPEKVPLSRSKTEPHIMLQKLESVLLRHQQGIGEIVIKPRLNVFNRTSEDSSPDNSNSRVNDNLSRKQRTLPKLPSNSCLETVPTKESEIFSQNSEKLLSGCFESLNCASSVIYAQRHFYEKLNEKKSEFFVESPLCVRKKSNSVVESPQEKNILNRSCSEEHIYAQPYAIVDVDSIRSTNLTEATNGRINLTTDSKQNKQALHYMCTPISALDRIDALLNNDSVGYHQNTDEAGKNLGRRFSESNIKTDTNIFNDCEKNEKSSRKTSFLHFTHLGKGSTEVTNNKLDRNKVQLFINQAFGSPVHGMPLTPLDSASSDSESVVSVPDEVSSSNLANDEDVFDRAEGGPASSGRQTGENMNEKQRHEMAKMVEQRKVYVRRVSSRVFNTRQRLSSSKQLSRLYHCIMLIGLNLDGEKRIKVPYIKSKYPPTASVPPLIEHLCFPDAADWPPPSTGERSESHFDEQSYSLVVTNENGHHMFGYCRRVKPEGTTICLPLAYCILSPHRAKGFYFKILSELESRHGQPEWLQTAFIKELYACEFPSPGQGLKLPEMQKGSGAASLESLLSSLATQLRRPLDARLEERDLTLLFSALNVSTLLQVFGSLLLERKVLFISNSISKLSSCIEALHSVLYPFSWQYTFIPVLPSAQIGICEAPTPFIIGVLKDKSGKSLNVRIEEGIVVDLEEGRILQAVGDESTILPSRMKKCLKVALQLVTSTTQDSEPTRNVLISEAFIRMFVEICGHYSNHIVTQQDGKKVFERESFIKTVPSQSIQLFLEWFTETAMFSVFIESRLSDSPDFKGLFEQRTLEHSEEMEKNTMLFLRNYKAINRKVKTLGDRLKDWTTFT